MRAISRVVAVRAHLIAFLQWWFGELRQLAELLLERVAPRLVNRVLVRFNATGASVWSLRGRDEQHLIDIKKGENGAWADTDPFAGDLTHLRGARAVLGLPAESILSQDFSLPASVESQLERVISLQLERVLPVQRDRVFVDYGIRERMHATRQLRLEVWIAHRDQVERLRELAQGWGLRPTRIAATTPSGEFVGNFMPTRVWFGSARLSRWDRALIYAPAFLAVLWLGVAGLQWGYERVKVGAELQRVHVRAEIVRGVLDQISHQSQPAQQLARISATLDAIDVLNSLTEVIPPEAWVSDLDVQAPAANPLQLRLSGFAPSARTLAETLEKSQQFAAVRLESATSAGLGSAMERLQLSASGPASRGKVP